MQPAVENPTDTPAPTPIALLPPHRPRRPPSPWARLGDEALLDKKISQLALDLPGTRLEPLIQRLYHELSAKGLTFHPPCFVGDEWFCPVGIPAIGIPFYLTHNRLRRLEEKMMLEVEGGTPGWFMRLMRHEAGHAYSYAYRLYRKKKWQELFGLASKEYETTTYRPRPYSRSYVVHLENWYAQSHPDEDFAETFAIWLTPKLNWKRRFRGWKALQKIEYVDWLMRSLAGKPPVHLPPFKPAEYAGLNIKLKTYYARKRKLYQEDYPDLHDNDLMQIFVIAEEGEPASHYLRARRKLIRESISLWTQEKKYTIDQLLRNLIDRCDELNLRVRPGDAVLDLHIVSYITTMVMNYLFTGKFKRSK